MRSRFSLTNKPTRSFLNAFFLSLIPLRALSLSHTHTHTLSLSLSISSYTCRWDRALLGFQLNSADDATSPVISLSSILCILSLQPEKLLITSYYYIYCVCFLRQIEFRFVSQDYKNCWPDWMIDHVNLIDNNVVTSDLISTAVERFCQAALNQLTRSRPIMGMDGFSGRLQYLNTICLEDVSRLNQHWLCWRLLTTICKEKFAYIS